MGENPPPAEGTPPGGTVPGESTVPSEDTVSADVSLPNVGIASNASTESLPMVPSLEEQRSSGESVTETGAGTVAPNLFAGLFPAEGTQSPVLPPVVQPSAGTTNLAPEFATSDTAENASSTTAPTSITVAELATALGSLTPAESEALTASTEEESTPTGAADVSGTATSSQRALAEGTGATETPPLAAVGAELREQVLAPQTMGVLDRELEGLLARLLAFGQELDEILASVSLETWLLAGFLTLGVAGEVLRRRLQRRRERLEAERRDAAFLLPMGSLGNNSA